MLTKCYRPATERVEELPNGFFGRLRRVALRRRVAAAIQRYLLMWHDEMRPRYAVTALWLEPSIDELRPRLRVGPADRRARQH
jgi:hypothetical protein